jgi:hypothetical protein
MNVSSTGPENWFYVQDGRRQGPLTRPELVRELLTLEAPEAALVWRTGLPAWTKASLVDELRRELPPPVPGALSLPEAEPEHPMPDLPADEGPSPAHAGEADESEGGDGDEEALGPGDEAARADEGSSEARRRRRRSSRKARPKAPPPYLLPLVLLFLAVMVGLWLLLRRMNEVPPGRIIHQGAVSGPSWGATPA